MAHNGWTQYVSLLRDGLLSIDVKLVFLCVIFFPAPSLVLMKIGIMRCFGIIFSGGFEIFE